jgi:putative Mg2+ transporter-C (MgtC) family protein
LVYLLFILRLLRALVLFHMLLASSPNIEGWRQVGELSLALGLSALIGVEREIRQRSAGLRTHALVGVGAALFMLVSKYGFNDVLKPGVVILDPSRVAAQIVTGIGFIGGGLIFVRRDAVRGLTTAAGIWVTAAIGAAAGAGLPVIAVCATVAYGLVVLGFSPLVRRLPRSSSVISVVRVRYLDGRGILREVLGHATSAGFVVAEVATQELGPIQAGADMGGTAQSQAALVEVSLQIHGKGSVEELAAELSELPGVAAVTAVDPHNAGE